MKCVEEIILATQNTTTYNHTGGMAFVGSTARSRRKYLKDPYWVAVKSYLNRNK